MNSQKYCTDCGCSLVLTGNVGIHNCAACGSEQRNHPQVVATCFVNLNSSFLWVKRAIEPQLGKWAIPGGYVESGETPKAGAAREVFEETGIQLAEEQLQFYMLGSLTFINQIYVGFRATVQSDESHPTAESSECQFFTRQECPWQELAYPEVNVSIEQAYDELESDTFGSWYVEMTENGYVRKRSKFNL